MASGAPSTVSPSDMRSRIDRLNRILDTAYDILVDARETYGDSVEIFRLNARFNNARNNKEADLRKARTVEEQDAMLDRLIKRINKQLKEYGFIRYIVGKDGNPEDYAEDPEVEEIGRAHV